ncbi:lipopolysaccharide biosynthesis protein [Xanthomonas maliensis]|uniref:lipopolysaccharide biosynthesis protein n=1 Tax=Xanthomonas maliensis TaxID=1321368 RepID=UPI0003A5C60A|nr:polysaccharide biosynthesis C-terminal domain-containing protein [Xanthomonas maliensis]
MSQGWAAAWRAPLRGLSLQWLSIVFTATVSLALSVWLARTMGPAGFGRYAYLLSLATLLALLQDVGLRTLVLREGVAASIPAPVARALPALARGHLIGTTLLLAAASLLVAQAGGDPALVWAVLCLGAVTLTQLVSAQLKAAGRWQRDAGWLAGARVVSALVVVAAVLLLGPAPGVVFAAWGSGLVLAYLWMAKDVHQRPRWRPQPLAYRAAASFFWIDTATALYRRSDVVILQHAVPSAALGQYAAAYRVFDGVLLLAMPVALLLFRQLRLRHAQSLQAQRLQTQALWIAAIAGLGLAAAGACLGSWLMEVLYGAAYRAVAGPILGWLFAAFVFVLPNYVLTQAAIAADQQRWYVIGAGLAAVVNIVLNLLLARAYGVRGAAAAVIVTEAMLTGVLWYGLRRAGRGRSAT